MEVSQKVAIQHHLIESLLKELVRAFSEGDQPRSVARLASLRRALEAHFALEEDHYFPALRESRPDVAGDLDGLVEQHASMRSDLAQIAGHIDEHTWDAARAALRSLDVTFHRHEEIEGKLLGGQRDSSSR